MNRSALTMTALLMLVACNRDPTAPSAESAKKAEPRNKAVVEHSPPARKVESPKPADPLVLAVEGEGLRLFNSASGAARPLPFGTAQETVLTALAARGRADSGTQSECGAGALDYAVWPDGLKLYFQQGKFTGWALDGRAEGKIATAASIGPGSSRRALEAAYAANFAKSSLGTEFTAGEVAGLLDGPGPKASIEAMWAGTSCNFR
jgi:hypothetical protein